MKKAYIFLFGLVVLVPLGLLTSNPAWGEWDSEFYRQKLGFIPKGIEKGSFFEAPFGDYTTSFLGDVGSYYLSAVLGIVLIFGIFYLLKRFGVDRQR